MALKSKTIYVLRHGQTEYNRKGMVQGRGVDSSLNDTGRNQAMRVYASLKDAGIKKIFVSELRRTKETVESFDLPVRSHFGFDEISWGSQEGVELTEKNKNFYWNTVKDWRSGQLTKRVGGGETPIEVMERQKLAMKEVISSEKDCVLICMHGRAMRILLCWLLNYPLQFMDGFDHQNCSYYKLSWSNGIYSIDEFNQTDHLK